ncbi:MAG: hypothetical protein BM556_09040 [Bacteriovorax sp. MedPE-SWde]|nr:MAG: hypothetical protein BM556_09040 [Bacteriovorax sp. MedPE-SWde]
MKKISIVTTAYNEEESVEELVSRVHELALSEPSYQFEFIAVENGSKDKTFVKLTELKEKFSFLRIVKLSRNFQAQGGMLAGISQATGDAIVTMDADLQHPPEVISSLIRKWEEGFKIVNTEKKNKSSTLLRLMADKFFYELMYKYSGLRFGEADFRLIDREVANVLDQLDESEKFLRGLISWTGFESSTVKYRVELRKHGVTKFSSRHLFEFAFLGLTSFSVAPLRSLLKLGFIIFVPSFIYLLFFLTIGSMNYFGVADFDLPPGLATLVVTVIFFGSIQILSIGVLGEYIGRIYKEVKGRPNFVIEEEV